MEEDILIGLAGIIGLGIIAQWLAWRFQLPSVLLLLIIGLIAGPATKFIEPDEMFGDLLLPIVSISVAVILFEGGMSLKLAELRQTQRTIYGLVTIGAAITWLIGTIVAYYLVDLSFDIAVLLGALLIVSGPTVIIPLLRHVRPSGRVGSILKWEGIVIDPIGAILAVLVFEVIISGRIGEAGPQIASGVIKTIFIGGGAGILSAGLFILALRRYWIPDFLQSPAALMLVIAVYAIPDLFQEESGLLAATVMGIVIGNQKSIPVRHITEFKENLGVLLVSGLFIVLAARLQTDSLDMLSWSSLSLLAILILVARPVAVILSTIKSGLSWPERAFLMSMAPRGIVAAAVASIFSLRLMEEGYECAELLVPITFLVILGTVTFYGLTAVPLARRLRVANPNPQGLLIVGAHKWARDIAIALQAQGFQVLIVDTDWAKLSVARSAGLSTFYASILSQYALDEIELSGIGHLLALTHNSDVNSLAALHFAPLLGRANVYQLSPERDESGQREMVSQHLRGRFLFGPNMSYHRLEERFDAGAAVKATELTKKFDYEAFREFYGEKAAPLFLIHDTGDLGVFTNEFQPTPQLGETIISLVDPSPPEVANGPQSK